MKGNYSGKAICKKCILQTQTNQSLSTASTSSFQSAIESNPNVGLSFASGRPQFLKDHLVRGYTLNQKQLTEKGLGEARQVLALLANTLERHQLVSDEGRTVLFIVQKYTKTWWL